jgi:hypothetical protein
MKMDRPGPWRAAVVAGHAVLLVLGVAWAVFERPAPVFNVTWREGLTDAARGSAERQLGLENRQPSNDSFQYELWSPRTREITAIVEHPAVADTGHIDRVAARIAPDAGRGRRVWWRGPFRGAGSPRQFRVTFAAIAAATLLAAWLARWSARPSLPRSAG